MVCKNCSDKVAKRAKVPAETSCPPQLEALERRILYSADVFGVNMPVDSPDDTASVLAGPLQPQPLPTQSATELVFVDTSIPEFDTILADLQTQIASGRALEVVEIATTDAGLDKVTDKINWVLVADRIADRCLHKP